MNSQSIRSQAALSLLCLLGLALAVSVGRAAPAAQTIFTGQGLLAGEVTDTSAILQARFTATEALLKNDVPGTRAIACFEVADNETFKDSIRTDWAEANATNDFTLQVRVSGLKPGTQHYYRVWFGLHPRLAQRDVARGFKTLPGAAGTNAVTFVAGGAMNYHAWTAGPGAPASGTLAASDRLAGYPVFRALHRLRPDFYIGLGNQVFHDDPPASPARTAAEMRRKWHEQFVLPHLAQFLSITPAFWLMNDRDFRFQHAGADSPGEPSAALGRAIFRQQLPVIDSLDTNAPVYRAHRVSRDLQIWLLESRMHRSPAAQPDGPDKSLWGAAQRAWLQRTLMESDATFKILVSPTPLLGPVDPAGGDSHASGYRHERDAFLAWLKENQFAPGRVFILCGDAAAWHVRHADGWEEFSSGALHAGAAWTTQRSQPNQSQGALIRLFERRFPAGGFMRVTLTPGARPEDAVLQWALHGEGGELLHSVERRAR